MYEGEEFVRVCGREDGLLWGTGLGCVWILYFRAVAWLALVEAMHS